MRSAAETAAERPGATLFQRIASWLLVVMLALTIIGFIATLLFTAYGKTNAFFGSAPFEYAFSMPLICLPIAIVALIAIVLSSARQKSQQRR